MSLDVGRKRIGVALSDPLCITANPWGYIDASPRKKALAKIVELIGLHEVKTVVIGYPLKMDGTAGEQAAYSAAFAESLKGLTDIDIVLSDERLTSLQAEKMLIDAGVSREKRKFVNDKLAASLILQQYLSTIQRRAD